MERVKNTLRYGVAAKQWISVGKNPLCVITYL
jgi:hypothetical protein